MEDKKGKFSQKMKSRCLEKIFYFLDIWYTNKIAFLKSHIKEWCLKLVFNFLKNYPLAVFILSTTL